MQIFLSKFFDTSKNDFLVEGAYAPASRIEFPGYPEQVLDSAYSLLDLILLFLY
jgi:hypothetical protein